MMRSACFALLLAVLAGCATQEAKPDPFVGWYKDYRNCSAEYAEIDARVAAAKVSYAGYYRVPGYPYLRTDRTLASFAYEVKTLEEIGGWIRRMREMDQEAREFEYRNLGMTLNQAAIQRDRFLNCGRILASIEFIDEPEAYANLLSAVQPQDDYSGVQRTLGLYALRASSMRARLVESQQVLDQMYAQPLEKLPASAPLTLWKPKPEADMSLVNVDFNKVLPDELGFPGLTESMWLALTEYHAPQLWIETASDADQPAGPKLTDKGVAADLSKPQVHYQVTFARFGGKALIQLNYLFWFKGANGEALDGFIWRVNLDDKAQLLAYESMHTSGSDHRWYPVRKLARREPADDAHGVPVIAPQPAPEHMATLRIGATTHDILRVVDSAEVISGSVVQNYEIRRYDDLLMMPLPGGGTRSLFGSDGLVAGTHGKAPIGGFASGIRAPGVLRQLGRHAIAPVGRAHFDEPFLLESVFVPPGKDSASTPPG